MAYWAPGGRVQAGREPGCVRANAEDMGLGRIHAAWRFGSGTLNLTIIQNHKSCFNTQSYLAASEPSPAANYYQRDEYPREDRALRQAVIVSNSHRMGEHCPPAQRQLCWAVRKVPAVLRNTDYADGSAPCHKGFQRASRAARASQRHG
jgi:hypothetical protein